MSLGIRERRSPALTKPTVSEWIERYCNGKGTTAKGSLRWEEALYTRRVFFTQFLASLLVHSQGLYALCLYHGSIDSILPALVGAGLEGVCFFSLVVCFLSRQPPQRWKQVLATIVSTILVFIMGSEALFQLKTSGSQPDMWVIIYGIKDMQSAATLSALSREFSSYPWETLVAVVWAYGSAGLAGWMVVCAVSRARAKASTASLPASLPLLESSEPPKRTKCQQRLQLRTYFGGLFLSMLGLYAFGAWMPVVHVAMSLAGSWVYAPSGWSAGLSDSLLRTAQDRTSPQARANAPHVILIMHDSLSAETLQADPNVEAPFYEHMVNSQDDFFVFAHARSMAGDTTDGLTAIQSGCLPLNHKEGLQTALATTLGTQFKRHGYDTASFSSCPLNKLEGTKWFMLYNQLALNFDQTWSPDTTGDPLLNVDGTNDDRSTGYFAQWLAERNEQTNAQNPFYAQFYLMDAHYPFFNNETISQETEHPERGMIRTVDHTLQALFRTLEDAGTLDNTVVLGVSDHGENVRGPWDRLTTWNERVLHPVLYLHLPKSVAQGLETPSSVRETLRHNTKRLVSQLDVYPTLMHLLRGNATEEHPETDSNCIRGLDLAETAVPDDRVTWSIPGINRDIMGSYRRRNTQWGSMALHSGTATSLMARWTSGRTNGLSVVEYGANRLLDPARETQEEPITDLDEWKTILEHLQGTPDQAVVDLKSAYTKNFFQLLRD